MLQSEKSSFQPKISLALSDVKNVWFKFFFFCPGGKKGSETTGIFHRFHHLLSSIQHDHFETEIYIRSAQNEIIINSSH